MIQASLSAPPKKRRWNVAPAGCFLLTLFLLMPGDTFARETIRVALFVDRAVLSFSSQGRLTIYSRNNKRLATVSTPLQIHPGRKGLRFNQRPTAYREVLIRTRASSIKINRRPFSGLIQVIQKEGRLTAVNIIDLEEYLQGVLPMEISPDWPSESLKAQAVAARTYALYRRENNSDKGYDLVSTTMDQVYGGIGRAHPASNQAIRDTRGLVMKHEGHLILAAYHSTSAGPTEDAKVVWGVEVSYLKGVICPFDRYSPRYQWTRRFSLDFVERVLSKKGYPVGFISTVTAFEKTGSGRVAQLRFLHSEGELILPGTDFRRVLGYSDLPSTRFIIERKGNTLLIKGKGSGHGVGLCQWGAKEMAELGYSFGRILKFYYPDVEVVQYSGG